MNISNRAKEMFMAAIRRVDYDKVEQMLREGAEVKEVASALGIHRQTICDGMKSRGVSIADMKFGLKFSPLQGTSRQPVHFVHRGHFRSWFSSARTLCDHSH
jgi:hypothetical protein